MPKKVKGREEISVVGLEMLLVVVVVGSGETKELELLKQITLAGKACYSMPDGSEI